MSVFFKNFTAFAMFFVLILIPVQNGAAEDLNEIFKKVNEFVASKNYPKAMTAETLKSMAQAVKIEELDKYLKGAAS